MKDQAPRPEGEHYTEYAEAEHAALDEIDQITRIVSRFMEAEKSGHDGIEMPSNQLSEDIENYLWRQGLLTNRKENKVYITRG